MKSDSTFPLQTSLPTSPLYLQAYGSAADFHQRQVQETNTENRSPSPTIIDVLRGNLQLKPPTKLNVESVMNPPQRRSKDPSRMRNSPERYKVIPARSELRLPPTSAQTPRELGIFIYRQLRDNTSIYDTQLEQIFSGTPVNTYQFWQSIATKCHDEKRVLLLDKFFTIIDEKWPDVLRLHSNQNPKLLCLLGILDRKVEPNLGLVAKLIRDLPSVKLLEEVLLSELTSQGNKWGNLNLLDIVAIQNHVDIVKFMQYNRISFDRLNSADNPPSILAAYTGAKNVMLSLIKFPEFLPNDPEQMRFFTVALNPPTTALKELGILLPKTGTAQDLRRVLMQFSFYAYLSGKIDVESILKNYLVDVSPLAKSAKFEAILFCIRNNWVGLIKERIRSWGINKVNRDRETPLMLAARKGSYEMVQALIDLDANVHITNKLGQTAKAIAIQSKDEEGKSIAGLLEIMSIRNKSSCVIS